MSYIVVDNLDFPTMTDEPAVNENLFYVTT